MGLVWAVFEVIALLLPEQLRFSYGGFSHYALPAIAALSLLAGSGVVWGWLNTQYSRLWRWGWVAAIVSIAILAVWPRWISAMVDVVWRIEYPQLLANELEIGEAVRAVTSEDEGILVLGNSGFYHWAKRPLSTKFYLIPAYFSSSPIGHEADSELMTRLRDGSLSTLLISRMHLDERVSAELSTVLWQYWEPVAVFSYPYQRDVFLFLPRIQQQKADRIVTSFAGGIELHALNVQKLGKEALLIDLSWLAMEPIMNEYVVFVHLLGEDGNLISQHDAIPGIGFRPTTSWQVQELVSDRHWLALPEGFEPEGKVLRIGLYRADNGERLSLNDQRIEQDDNTFQVRLSDIE